MSARRLPRTMVEVDEHGRPIAEPAAETGAVLDQVASALARHAGPMLVRDVLPAIQNDPAMQERVGAAAGREMGREIAPWLAIGAVALGVLAVGQILRWTR